MPAKKVPPVTRNNFRARPKRPPGPTGMPLLGNLLRARKDPLRFTLDLARSYGDVAYFRVGTYRGYLLNHPDYFQHVLKYNHRNYNKDNYNFRKLKPVLGEGLITADGERWARAHRLIQPAFHRKRMAGMAPIVTGATREMLERWEVAANKDQPVAVNDDMMTLTLAIITRSLFGADIRSSAAAIGKAFSTLNEDVSYRFKTVFVPPRWIPTPRNRRFKKALASVDRQVYAIIEQRRSSDTSRNDLLGMLLNARDQNASQGMTDRQLRDEVMTLLLAGHETTANLLDWTCYLVSRHPQVAHKLQQEITEVLGDRDPVAGDLPKLQYMKMVLRESLRLYPPVWIISRQAIGPDEIGGYPVPAGSTVTLCSYALHRHPEFWDQPEAFRPERFKGYEEGKTMPAAYFPFGTGPRACIGAHLAMMEAQLILAMILRRYRLHLVAGTRVEPEPLVTLRPRNGLNVKLEPALASSSPTGLSGA